MVTTKLNLSMTEPQVRQIYAKQGDTGRVLDITLDQTPEDGTLRILRPDGVEVTSEAVTGGEVESGSSFESLTEADVTELTVGIEPIQDLNGYDKPWVGGAGKNKLVYPYTDTTKTASGITFTDNGDGSIKLNGTATANIDFYLLGEQATYYSSGLASGSYTMRVDSESGTYTGDINKFVVEAVGNTLVGNGITSGGSTFQLDSTKNYRIFVRVVTGTIVNNLVLRPMIYLATETDPTWQPYSNICPITGHDEVRVTRTGKNLLNLNVRSKTQNGITFTVYADGSIKVNGTATGNANFNGTTGAPSKISAGTTVTLSGVEGLTTNQLYLQLIYTEADGSTISIVNTASPTTHTFTQDATFVSYWLAVRSGATLDNVMVYPQLELGSTATAYEPYQGSTYTTSLGQTVYGGTLDMVTGVLTVDKKIVVFDGIQNDFAMASTTSAFYSDGEATEGVVGEVLSNQYPYGREIGAASASSLYPYTVCVQALNGVRFIIYNPTYTTASDFNAYLNNNPLQVVYPLASPQTYTLTAHQIKTLVGTNNVWASSGDIVNIKFTYGGLLSELPSDATSIVGKCYCDIEQNGVSSMPFTLNVKKNERQ